MRDGQLLLISTSHHDTDILGSFKAKEWHKSLDVQVRLAIGAANYVPSTQNALNTKKLAVLVQYVECE